MRFFLVILRLVSKRRALSLLLLLSGLFWLASRADRDTSVSERGSPRIENTPPRVPSASLPVSKRVWTPAEMSAVDPLKKAGSAIRLLNILEMRDEPAKNGSPRRRSWLVETNFEQPYLRVDQDLGGATAEEVIHSQIYIADQVVVALKAEADPPQALASIHRAGFEQAEIIQHTSSVLVHLDRHDLDAVPEASGRLAALKDVLAAEPDGVGSGALIPNDLSFGTQWHLHNTGQSGGTVDADVDAPEFWDIQPNLPSFSVAVLDSGLDYNHQDLAGALWTRTADTPGNSIDDDGNGKVDDFRGWDFVNNDNDPMDDLDHGTHVSGTIAARRNNVLGIAGIFPEARIVPLKIINAFNSGSSSNLIAALGYVRTLNVRLVNMSIGGYGYSTSVLNEITAGQAQGILYVISAGNQGANNDAVPYYPGSYPQDNIICVGNSNRSDVRYTGSSYGLTSVDVFAPGTLIPSTVRDNDYSNFTGTSMAAPHVTAAAAIIWSARPQFTWQEVKSMIFESSESKPALDGLCVTGKRLNLHTLGLAALLEIAIENPAGTDLVSDTGSQAFPATDLGKFATMTYTLRNQGLLPLAGLAISFEGSHAQDYTLASSLPSSLAPGQSVTFDIRFTPSAAGSRQADVHVSSNDPDENPFVIHVSGSGVPVPEIAVFDDTLELTDGDASLAYGIVNYGSSVIKTLRIQNTGTAALSGLQIAKTGDAAGNFAVSTIAESLAPGAELTLNVTFTPQAPGLCSAALSIASNDTDENPFNISLTGIGTLMPEIVILEDAQEVADGTGTLAFGSVKHGLSTMKVLRIRNIGTAPLHSLQLTMTGSHAADFSTPTLLEPIEVGGEFLLNVTFAPQYSGARSATLHIASNDADENPFDIILTGTGLPEPEIAVNSAAGTSLITGLSKVSFGSTRTTETYSTTITIRNTGSANLIVTPTILGPQASEFSISPSASALLPASTAEVYQITCQAADAGLRSATLRLTSNDANENPFDLALEATGIPPAPPSFTTQPQSRLVFLGSPATFAPVVTGDPVINYEWKKGNATLKQGTQPEFSIATTQLADVAAYTVVADNPVGPPKPSEPAYLGLITPNEGTQILKAGTTLTLKCTVTAPSAPGVKVKYSWRRVGDLLPLANGPLADNGPVVSGADKATLSISKMRVADEGAYTCLVTLETPGNDPDLTNGEVQVEVVDAPPTVQPIPLPAELSVSESVDETITATNFPKGFTVTGLPKGLKMDPKTGRITGKPTEPSKKSNGVYVPNKMTFKATNAWGTSTGLDFVMTIHALEPEVIGTFHGIVARSAHSNFGLGGHAQITVSATGAVSGSATLAGQKHTLVGSLDSLLGRGPAAVLTIKRTPPSPGDLQLVMEILTEDNLLEGRIIEPAFEQTTNEIALGDPSAPDMVNGSAEEARFNSPGGIAILPGGSGYVADTGNHLIRFISAPANSVTTFAGSSSSGFIDGIGTAARFKNPEGLALDAVGNLYVADTGNATIRRITPAGSAVTMAGTPGRLGAANGIGSATSFTAPCALCFDPAGNLYIADRGNHLIRKMTPAGVVTTLAGKAGISGHKDGSGTSALFKSPRGITYDPVLKALFVADTQNRVIRKVTLTGAVTTYAGSPGVEAYADGLLANARFGAPTSILSLGNGTLIVGDSRLVKIHPNGVAAAISGLVDTDNALDRPVALGFDAGAGAIIAAHDLLHALTRHVSDEPLQNARINARRSTWATTNLVHPDQQGLFNAVLETTAPPEDTSFPPGDGYVQVSISKNGVATWAGKAADGSGLTFSTFMSSDRKIPLHVPLYKNTGSLQGETSITTPDLDLIRHSSLALDWYKIPQPLASKDRSYKSGFLPHALELYGGRHVPNHLHSSLGLTNSPATLGLDFTASLISGFTQNFTLTTPNAVAVAANNRSFDLKIDPKTGLFTGNFKEGSPAVTVPFSGVLIRYAAGENLREGRGHYLVPASASSTSPVQSARVWLGRSP